MARINIEDSLFKDSRFLKLVIKTGDQDKALGMVVWAFMIAQKHFLTDVNDSLATASDRLIPIEDWKKQGCSDLLIEVGLAEKRGNGVYVSGSENQFKWLIQRQIAGQRGGLNKGQAVASGRLAEESGPKPLSLTHSLTQNKKENTNVFSKKNKPKKQAKQVFEGNLEHLYEKYPRKMGKSKGLEKLAKIIKTETDLAEFERALDRFITLTAKNKTEPQFIPHFSTFVNSHWQDYLDENVGDFVGSQNEVEPDRDWYIPESERGLK